MNTLCVVAVVVLSFTSVCQPAPLTCNKLLEQVTEAPDISGRWYLIALSMPNCWSTALVGGIFQGIAFDVTSQNAPNLYELSIKMILGPQCFSTTELFSYQNRSIFDVDSDNMTTGTPELLLQTGCPDCMVLKDAEDDETLMFLSKRKQVTSEELEEFSKRSKCLGWAEPFTLKHSHDYETCKSLEDVDEDDFPALGAPLMESFKNMLQGGMLRCFAETIGTIL